jgi:hypothetical protein
MEKTFIKVAEAMPILKAGGEISDWHDGKEKLLLGVDFSQYWLRPEAFTELQKMGVLRPIAETSAGNVYKLKN